MLIIIKYTQYTKIQTYTPNREHLSGFKGTFVTQRAEKEENPTFRGTFHLAGFIPQSLKPNTLTLF